MYLYLLLFAFNPTGTPRRIHVDSTWILRRYVEDQISMNSHVIFAYFFRFNFDGQKIHVVSSYSFQCNFDGRKIHVVSTYFYQCNFASRKIHVVSTYFFRCNFDGRKIHVVSTYFFRCNFDGRKIHVVSTYFFQCNFDGRNVNVVFTYFFRRNFDGQKFDIVFGKLEANENIGEGFSCVCNFKQLTFARLFSLNFSSKSPWCSPVPLKFESYNLRHCKKNYCNLDFLKLIEQLLYQIIFGQVHCYEVTLVKKCNKPLLQKSETKVFDQTKIYKKLNESEQEK